MITAYYEKTMCQGFSYLLHVVIICCSPRYYDYDVPMARELTVPYPRLRTLKD